VLYIFEGDVFWGQIYRLFEGVFEGKIRGCVQEDIGQILGYSRAEFKGDIFQGGKYNCTKP
jgi:hypothetical protein